MGDIIQAWDKYLDREVDKRQNFEKIVRHSFDQFEYLLNPGEESPFFPEHIHIEPTNTCNLHCVHCHQSMRGTLFNRKLGMMDFHTYKKIIDEVCQLSSRITLNLQGEPLLNKSILEMVQYAKGKYLSVSLLTNATLLDVDIAEELIRAPLDRIVFSHEGSNEEVFSRVRRGGKYQQTLLNILNFIKLNYDFGLPAYVAMSMIESSYTTPDVEKYREYFSQFPINTIFVSPLLNLSGGSPLSEEVSEEALKSENAENAFICRIPWENLSISWDGSVIPCPLDYNATFIAGNVKERSLQDIWNGEGYREFRRAHLTGNFSEIEENHPLCGKCSCRYDKRYDEYNIYNAKEYLTNHIIRQADIFPRSGGKESGPANYQKYEFLLKEISRLKNSQ